MEWTSDFNRVLKKKPYSLMNEKILSQIWKISIWGTLKMNSTYDILFKNHDPDDGIIKKSKVSHMYLNKYNMGNAYLTHLPHLSIVTMELRGCGRPRVTGFWLRFRLAQN